MQSQVVACVLLGVVAYVAAQDSCYINDSGE